MVLRKDDVLSRYPQMEPYYRDAGEWINTGNSMIADPECHIIAGPLSKEEGILYADVDLEHISNTRWNLDVAGHYARPDAFQLTVRTTPNPVITIDRGSSVFPSIDVEDNTFLQKDTADKAESV
ncbi:MAG: nitrilase-related carbon-nitrogen hydrolase, partial [Desulfobacteraceae bacterium]|jgi:nitrilase